MTRVCLVGKEGQNLSYELLSRETAREALAAYDLREPFHNTVAVETVSLGAAVALLNDLDWYLVRFVDEALVFEPSVSEDEWLSRDLARAIRDGRIDAAETGRLLKVYGLEYPAENDEDDAGDEKGDAWRESGDGKTGSEGPDSAPSHGSEETGGEESDDGSERGGGKPRLVEPMFVARTGDQLPEYDLRAVDETLLVRVTEAEFGAGGN